MKTISLKYISIVLLLCLASSLVHAQQKPIEIKATMQPDSIMIGDYVHFTIKASYNKTNQQVAFPQFKDKEKKGKIFEFIEEQPLDTIASDADKITVEQRYIITSFDSGVHVFPSIPVLVQTNSAIDTVYTDSLLLKVNTIAIDTATYQMFDIKAPAKYPFNIWDYWWIGAILLGIIIVVLLMWLYMCWRKNRKIFDFNKPKDPPYLIALTELRRLKEEKLLEQDKIKQYYTRLTDIVRKYIEDVFGVQAMEKTSDEILQALVNAGFDRHDLYTCLKDMFINADLAKFAKYKPTAHENERSYQYACQFVEGTKPQEKNDNKDIPTHNDNDTEIRKS